MARGVPKNPKSVVELPKECSAAELAHVLGKSSNLVTRLAYEGIIKRSGENRYNLAECVQTYIKKMIESAKASLKGEDINKSRLAAAKADQAELEVAKTRGEYAPTAQVHTLYRSAGERIKIRMLAIPSRVAPRLGSVKSAQEAAALIHEEIVLALTELNQLPDTAASEPDEEEAA